ncbi:MAG TPA: SDR family oxidoreductase [Gaiellaceae bacterium]|nr:SDR family oxidoreductase [Gaiellaceae bacterium]
MPAAVVLGARNLGGAILDRLLADGWSAAAVARSDDTLAAVEARGALPLRADATSPAELADALARAGSELGGLDLLVNAVSVARPQPGEPWGGGPVADATLDRFTHWTAQVAQLGFVFLSEGARALRAHGGGTLVQVTNASSRRPAPGSGLWSAGHHAIRALTLAAAQELRDEGIHACLLVVAAPIDSPKVAARLAAEGVPADATADQAEIASAVAFLAGQGARGLSYELELTAVGQRWLP